MVQQLRPAIVVLAVLTFVTGIGYPLAVTGVAQVAIGGEADGSRIVLDGELRGSTLVAAPFDGEEWFHPRPSAVDHHASESGGTNLGPTNPDLLAEIERRSAEYRRVNLLDEGTPVPIDAVTASGSGIDPHISPRNARHQARRVAAARGLPAKEILALVGGYVERRTWAVLGEPRVNIVRLNLALARLQG